MRSTAARMAILQCLSAAPHPLSALDIAENLSTFGFDKSTIYRALTDLHDAALVNRLELGDAPRHFELSSQADATHPPHPHFVCIECHRIFCLELAQVALKKGKDGAALPGEVTEVLIKGRCTHCQ